MPSRTDTAGHYIPRPLFAQTWTTAWGKSQCALAQGRFELLDITSQSMILIWFFKDFEASHNFITIDAILNLNNS